MQVMYAQVACTCNILHGCVGVCRKTTNANTYLTNSPTLGPSTNVYERQLECAAAKMEADTTVINSCAYSLEAAFCIKQTWKDCVECSEQFYHPNGNCNPMDAQLFCKVVSITRTKKLNHSRCQRSIEQSSGALATGCPGGSLDACSTACTSSLSLHAATKSCRLVCKVRCRV